MTNSEKLFLCLCLACSLRIEKRAGLLEDDQGKERKPVSDSCALLCLQEKWAEEKQEQNQRSKTLQEQQIWEAWISGVASQGISFARGRLDVTDTLLVHAAPEKLTIEVYDENQNLVARGTDLPRTADTPMARLHRQGEHVIRQDIWPTEADYGLPVLLAGGEVGILQHWWNNPEQREWRWRIELYNHR